jgi:GMP synthase-like glutamine amidotransferase
VDFELNIAESAKNCIYNKNKQNIHTQPITSHHIIISNNHLFSSIPLPICNSHNPSPQTAPNDFKNTAKTPQKPIKTAPKQSQNRLKTPQTISLSL